MSVLLLHIQYLLGRTYFGKNFHCGSMEVLSRHTTNTFCSTKLPKGDSRTGLDLHSMLPSSSLNSTW
ncbi:hypothetical protein Pcinc_028047 [Petrolisthes cinctipes]|uniref:Uncharacterized protein n=1 Tax=Petrolisthes cinctipes TaxID=88211 RepID=A0AAE1F4G6_PETCI|nr:hypothetical protein Pcinc_028047 [Petrolisthes cinctipes]